MKMKGLLVTGSQDHQTAVATVKRYNDDLELKLNNCRSLLEQMRMDINGKQATSEKWGDGDEMEKLRVQGSAKCDIFDIIEDEGRLSKNADNRQESQFGKGSIANISRDISFDASYDGSYLQEAVIPNHHVSSHDPIQYERANRRPVINLKAAKVFQVDKEYIRRKYMINKDKNNDTESSTADTRTDDGTSDEDDTYEETLDEGTVSTDDWRRRRRSDWVTRPTTPTAPSCFSCCIADDE